jgi:hypothetical protein
MQKQPFTKVIESEIGFVIEEDTDTVGLDSMIEVPKEDVPESEKEIDVLKELKSLAKTISDASQCIQKTKDILSKWKNSSNTELHLASEKIVHEIEDISEFLSLSLLELEKTAKNTEAEAPQ